MLSPPLHRPSHPCCQGQGKCQQRGGSWADLDAKGQGPLLYKLASQLGGSAACATVHPGHHRRSSGVLLREPGHHREVHLAHPNVECKHWMTAKKGHWRDQQAWAGSSPRAPFLRLRTPSMATMERLETGDGHHVSIAIPPYITTAILCLYCNFSTLLYRSAKSKSNVTSNAYREVRLILSTKSCLCRVSKRTHSEGSRLWQALSWRRWMSEGTGQELKPACLEAGCPCPPTPCTQQKSQWFTLGWGQLFNLASSCKAPPLIKLHPWFLQSQKLLGYVYVLCCGGYGGFLCLWGQQSCSSLGFGGNMGWRWLGSSQVTGAGAALLADLVTAQQLAECTGHALCSVSLGWIPLGSSEPKYSLLPPLHTSHSLGNKAEPCFVCCSEWQNLGKIAMRLGEEGHSRDTAHKEPKSRSAFHDVPQHKDWEHMELGEGWFKTGESAFHTAQRGHLRGWMGQVALHGQDWQVCEQILQAADRAVPSASWSRCHGGHEDVGLWQGWRVPSSSLAIARQGWTSRTPVLSPHQP